MVVFKNCVIFSHGTAVETEVAGASLYLSRTTISILGPAGVGVGGTGKGVDVPESQTFFVSIIARSTAPLTASMFRATPVGPTPTSAQVTIGFNRLRNC
jgi:hypothetical protein